MENNIDLNKLPPDIKKEFMKYALKLSEKKTKSKEKGATRNIIRTNHRKSIHGKI